PLLIPQVLALLIPGSRTHVYINSVYGLAGVFFAVQILSSLATYTYQSLTILLGIKVGGVLKVAVYEKTLRLSAKAQARKENNAGKINTLMASDVNVVAACPTFILNIIGQSLQLIIAIVLLFCYLRVAAVPAMALYAALIFFEMKIMPRIGRGIKRYAHGADSRSKILREWLHNVFFIKVEAMEDVWRARVDAFRSAQMEANVDVLTIFGLFFASGSFRGYMIPPLALLVYALFHPMDAETIFTSLALLDAIAGPSEKMSAAIGEVVRCPIPYKRVSAFLLAEETCADEIATQFAIAVDRPAIRLASARFTWEFPADVSKELAPNNDAASAHASFAIEATLEISQGSLVAVIGNVGSGKSSLLSALVGGMRKTAGEASVFGSVAYCSQSPWLLSASVEENIVFGHEPARPRVQSAIESACLEHDLDLLPHGRQTWIGEKGINLSGGQKSRVALARALARDADIYVLDDPTSALDAHVSRRVLDGAICTLLREKTVIVATNALHMLPRTDLVVVMRDGAIAETGVFNDLMADSNSFLSNMMQNYAYDERKEEGNSAEHQDEVIMKAIKNFEVQKAIAEDRKSGATDWATIVLYFAAGGPLYLLGVTIFVVLVVAASSLGRIFLALWAKDSLHISTGAYIRWYAGLGVVNTLLIAALVTFVFVNAMRAGKLIHDKAMDGVQNAWMPFFEVTPSGQILNRLVGDCEEVDTDLLINVYFVAREAAGFLTAVLVVAYSAPYTLSILFIIALVATYIFRIFNRPYRDLKRLTSVMISPVLSHTSETVAGSASIKAYRVEEHFIEAQHAKIDRSNAVSLLFQSAKVWLGLRLDLLTSTVVLTLVLLGALGVVSGVSVGLGLTGAISLGRRFNVFLITWTSASAMFNSVERLDFYRTLPSEPARTLPGDPAAGSWPTNGEIVVRDLVLRYAARMDRAVIDGVSFRITPGEKVAICGRTGSGKSSLAAAFFRILDVTGGSISIDSRDISQMGLKTLRESIRIVPQDPAIFEGTVRSNLNLTEDQSDEALWSALTAVGLHDHVSSLPRQLDSALDESGKNLSAGQKQLFALARAVLHRPKVLILDEATSSLDAAGATRAYDLLDTVFAHTTVMSIMHSLTHVARFDRVMLFEDGKLLEFDSPRNLLGETTKFAELLNATGPANAARVRETVAVGERL
ncbi:Multidrug resistance-associated protein 1, partial [Geranomyces variabilis]